MFSKRAQSMARYSSVFISMLIFVILSASDLGSMLVTQLLFTLVALTGVFLASDKKSDLIIAACLGAPWLTLIWIDHFLHPGAPPTIFQLSGVTSFLLFTTVLIFRHVAYAKEGSADLLFAAGAVYLMMGTIFAAFYQIILNFNPMAISFPEGMESNFSSLLYFSFTTLTTLGYGDILPVSSGARAVVITEAIIGVLFTTILVARLLGLYINSFAQKEE